MQLDGRYPSLEVSSLLDERCRRKIRGKTFLEKNVHRKAGPARCFHVVQRIRRARRHRWRSVPSHTSGIYSIFHLIFLDVSGQIDRLLTCTV